MISPIISPVTYFLISEQLPPEKNCPLSGLRFESRLGLVFGLGANQTIVPKENIPLVRVRVWIRVSFEVREQLS